MTGKEVVKALTDQDMLDKEVLINVLLCDPSTAPARHYRFHIESVSAGEGEDNLDSNFGMANELNIHQNESLRSWCDEKVG